jgi:hypothetical protein
VGGVIAGAAAPNTTLAELKAKPVRVGVAVVTVRFVVAVALA